MKYPERESATLEFKRELPTKQQIVKTVIAFCNTFGGNLIVGVDDNREIVGVPEDEIEKIIENLRRSIYQSTTPEILPSISTKRFGNQIVLMIEVSKGTKKPYFLTSKGLHEGTYIRFGTETLVASDEMIQDLQWQSRGFFLDEIPVYRAEKKEIDSERFAEFLQSRKKRKPTDFDLEEMLLNYGLLIREHQQIYPTVAGMLLFGKDPQTFLSESFIICTHFAGNRGREAIATKDFTGNLLEQFEECFSYILSRLSKEFFIGEDGIRHEQLEIPAIAVRESLINAIVHRHYSMSSPTKIIIYDDRMEFITPGNFPGPIRPNHFDLGVTFLRNGVIARIFRELGIIEKMGTGLITIFESYQERELIRPIIREGIGIVKYILPRPLPKHRELKKFGSAALEIMRLFYLKKEVRIADIIDHLDISRSTAGRLLNDLVDNHFVQRLGKGPQTVYLRS